MPAKSKAQRRLGAICEHNPSKAKTKCPPPEVSKEFAKTKEKDLPNKAPKK